MCPPSHPSRPVEIGMDLSDQQIIAYLDKFSNGSNLPPDVLNSPSLYQLAPADLPKEKWFLAKSDVIKESVYGFWNAKGEASEIYSDDFVLIGSKSTFEYFDGKPPNGFKTDWQMHVYIVALKKSLVQTKTKENRSLCRVFLHCEQMEKSVKDCKEVTEQNPVANISSNQDCTPEAEDKKDEPENDKADAIREEIARGDFLELDDLKEPLSPPFDLTDIFNEPLSPPFDLTDIFNEPLSPFVYDEKEREDDAKQLDEAFGSLSEVFLEGSISSSQSSGSLIRSLDDFFDSERVIDVDRTVEASLSFTDVATTSDGDRKRKTKKLKMFFCFMLY